MDIYFYIHIQYLKSFELWRGRRMGISWSDCLKNEKVIWRVKEERNILHAIKWRKTNCVGHILRRDCLLKRVIEGKIEGRIDMTEKRGERCQQLLGDLKAMEGYRKLKAEALDHTLWRTHFGRGYGPIWCQIFVFTFITMSDDWLHVKNWRMNRRFLKLFTCTHAFQLYTFSWGQCI